LESRVWGAEGNFWREQSKKFEIKVGHELGMGVTCLQSQLFRRQRKEDLKFKASTGKVSEALSQSQNANPKAGGMIQEMVHIWPTVLKDLG
jgi:hypothetical protein